MRSLRWVFITVALVLGLGILAIAIGAVWLNSFIHSDAFKAEIESRASQTLGGPVQVQSVDLSLLQGVKLLGVVTQIDPSHDGGQGAVKMQVVSVNCAYSWTDLLHGELRLTGITLDQPVIVLTKQPTEPMARAEAASANASAPSGPVVKNATAVPFQFVLEHAKVSDGSLSIDNAEGTPMVTLKGINAAVNTSGFFSGKDVTGTLKIADLQGSNLHITSFSTPITWRQNQLDANPFEGSAFNGSLAGDYHLDSTTPSVLDLNAKGFDVAQLTAATSSGSSSRLSGSLDFQSKWRGAESGDPNGEGDAQLTNGKLEGVKILEKIGRVLKINELVAPIITSAKTHFVVQNRQTRFIGLQVVSPLFQITGDGVVGFEGGLNANLVLILNRSAMSRLPQAAAASFVQGQDGTGSVAFQVTGTTSDPKTDLAMRLLMQNTEIKNGITKR